MRRLLPHPALAALLLAFWLGMQQSAGLGHILLGGAVAIAVSKLASLFASDRVRIRNPHRIIQLVFVAGLDIIRSNLAVLLVLVSPRPDPKAGFIEMKLELTSPTGLAVLACIITATPGSAWLEYDGVRNTVLIHVFDLVDEAQWIETIRARYEALLLEIFQ
ncbi:MAG: Na+/H+ antiporter subunit E [Devosia sp.]|jgi:multicomponent K+:H+ antiporter subunit E